MMLFAATTNAGKLREFAHCAAGAGAGGDDVEIAALPGIEAMAEPVEDAATFMGNAELKAVAYSRMAPGVMVLADDSGLEVAALGYRPGVRSARFADDLGFAVGEGSKNDRNNRAVLALLAELPQAMVSREARFVCALAVAQDGAVVARGEGACVGTLLREARGTLGFGYDPLFLVARFGLTMGELTPEQKWTVSHRGAAFRGLLQELEARTKGGNA